MICGEPQAMRPSRETSTGAADVGTKAHREGNAPASRARRLIHAFADPIEIDPHHRRGAPVLLTDAFTCLEREISSRDLLGHRRGAGVRECAAV